MAEKLCEMEYSIRELVLVEITASAVNSIMQPFARITSLSLVVEEEDFDGEIFSILVNLLCGLSSLRELRCTGADIARDVDWRSVDSSEESFGSLGDYLEDIMRMSSIRLERLSWTLDEFRFSDLDFISCFAATLQYLDIGLDDTCVLLAFIAPDSPVPSFPLLTTLKISGRSDFDALDSLVGILSLFASSPLTDLHIHHETLADELPGGRFVEAISAWKKTLNSLTLNSPTPYRHTSHLSAIVACCREHKIQLVLRGDYLATRIYSLVEEEGAEAFELAALESKLSALLDLAMGECDRALALDDDRGLFELWNDYGALADRERFVELVE